MKAIAAAAPFAEVAASSSASASALPQLSQSRSRALESSRSASGVRDASLCSTECGGNDSSHSPFDNAIVEAVLALKPDVLTRDATGKTAFDWAKRTGNAPALRLLDAYHRANSLHNAATLSREQRITECLALLARHDALVAALEQRFLDKHGFDETALIRFLEAAVASVSLTDFATSIADLRTASVAVASKLDDPSAAFIVNHESRQGWTPLTKAAANGYVTAVQVLLQLGASMHYETRLRHTALTWASYCGHEAVVLHFLRAGVRVEQQTREGKTALMHAVCNAQPKVVHHLLLALRELAYPTKAKDAFDTDVTLLNRRKSMKSAWKRVVRDPREVENRLEWHEAFGNLVHVRDASGKTALEYAEERCRRAPASDRAASPSDSTDTTTAEAAVLRQLQAAVQDAQSHAQYVAQNEERTRKVKCRSAGCAFVGPRDSIAVHEQHQCLKRVVHCDQCAMAVVFEAQDEHDQTECAMRRVACANLQHGCLERVRFRDAAMHSAHHCRKRLVCCRLKCGKAVVFDDLVAHETVQCPLRIVECELGCPATFLANESAAHRRKHCPKRQVVCASGSNGGGGGCGMLVVADEMAFHVAYLCAQRKFACQWATNGCAAAIGGPPESRYHHEQRECPFRPVACRNACALSGSILHCFLREHYAWQCELERKSCPHRCTDAESGDVLTLPAYLLDVHVLEDAGDCVNRMARCPLDLCGKRLTLFDALERSDSTEATLMTSDIAMSAREHRDTSLRALQQRVAASQSFLDRLCQSSRTGASDGVASELSSGDGSDDDEEARILMTQSAITQQVLIEWLRTEHARLERDLTHVEAAKQRTAVQCRVLTYALTDDHRGKHLIEFADGHSEWRSLDRREYDVHLPVTSSSSSSADGQVNPMDAFQCPRIEANALAHHVAHECALRLVPCPLGCAQRLPSSGVATHVAKRCNMRNASCRLGCGAVMPFASLGEHEDVACVLRSVFCEHCHASVKWQALANHLERVCTERPRRCRLGCGLNVAWSNTDAHEASHCPKRLVMCARCSKAVWFCEQRVHDEAECPLREYGPCDAQCGQVLRYNEVGHHLLFNCPQRTVTCANCEQRLTFAKLPEHKALLCPYRMIHCRRGCGELLAERDAEHHEDDVCAKRLVFCSNKCGAYVPCCDLASHQELACEVRVIECPSGCEERLVAYQFASHWKRCRQRLCPCGTGAKTCVRPIRLWYANRRLVRCAAHHETALLYAIKANDEDLATYLLQSVDAPLALDEECANGFAPLSMAVSLGHVELVKVLLRFGADVNAETSRGRTALAEACLAQHAELVALLIEHRANVSHTNRHGRNLLATVRALAVADDDRDDRVPRESSPRKSSWRAIVQLLEEREAMERQQRELFVAIATSDYDFLAHFLKFSTKRRSASRASDELQLLRDELHDHEARVAQAHAEHSDAIRVFNESVADTETKMVTVSNLSAQVLDCTSQIARVDSHHDTSLADSSALEVDMQKLIREITAQDIAKLLNVHVPPDEYLVVMKSICMLSGVLPRGRRNAAEYTDMEWWKAAQALLMDRTLLQRLRGYRKTVVTPDVMAKVRRECLRTPAFAASTVSFDALATTVEETPNSVVERKVVARLPPVDELRGNIVTLLAAWVKGVEMEYKSRAERQTLSERKRRLAISLTGTRESLEQAQFDMNVATRSLPARQDEVEAARVAAEAAERALAAAQQRLQAFRILTFSALNGHTPLSFAAAVGNEAMVHMLLAHGANAGVAEEEQHLCASFLQLLVRDFVAKRRQKRQGETNALKTRSDEAIDALVRNVAFTFLLSHYRRKIAFFRQTHRVALHEAIFNGFPQIVDILLANGATLWHKTRVLPLRAFPGAIDIDVAGANTVEQQQHALPGGWKLTPLIDDFVAGAASSLDRKPMLPRDTLELAMRQWDCKTYRASKGWDPDATRYSETSAFVSSVLTKLEDALAQRRKEIAARKNVAKKTAELRALHAALERTIVARDFLAASALLDSGAYADYETSRDGVTVLMAACIDELYVENQDKRDVLAVEFLLDRPTNHPFVNCESSTGRTALSTAAFHGTLMCAQVLLDRGANVNQASRRSGETALMVAAANGKTDMVRFLIEQPDVDVLAVDATGKTAFAHAQASGFSDAMHLLGAAAAGNRGRFYSSVSALYGVCKWGCGFMAPTDDRSVRESVVTHVTHPLAQHEAQSCPKRLVACPLHCTSAEIWAETLPQHLASECPRRIVTCTQPKCSASFPHEHLATHNRDECAFRTIHCTCGEQMTHQKHVVHAQSRCPMRLVSCPLECGAGSSEGAPTDSALRFMDLKHHQSAECPNRRVRCRNGCSANDLLFKQRGHHERHLCSLRRVACKWGCDESVLANAQQHHESSECLLRELPCPNKCGQLNVVFLELQQHVAELCARRLVLCALGCGRKVPLHVADQHVLTECRKRVVACELCGEQLIEDDRSAHQSTACAQRISLCGLCGQTNIPFGQLAVHRAEQCKMRQVQCKHKCFVKLLLAHERERHETTECAFRPIWCPLGCRQVLIANTLKKHERACEMRIVSCSLGCGVELRERDRAHHEATECSQVKRRA